MELQFFFIVFVGAMNFALGAINLVQGEMCAEIRSCSHCLNNTSCSYFLLNEGGICETVDYPASKYISRVRSPLSCEKVEGIIKAHSVMVSPKTISANDSLPVNLPLVYKDEETQPNPEKDSYEPAYNGTSGDPSSVFSVDDTFMRKGFNELKLDFLQAHCKLYILIFRKLHVKSLKVRQEYLRCLKRM